MIAFALVALLASPPEGKPLFYWGARPAVIVTTAASTPPDSEAQVTEVHAARLEGRLVLRFTFDRRVQEASHLADGTPVSGRLRAVLYLDADDERRTGLAAGDRDLRTGADLRLEAGVVSVGADPEEEREAAAVISVTLVSLTPDGRRRTLWRADDDAQPDSVSAHGTWLEVRLPEEPALAAPARLILAAGDQTWNGRLEP